MTRKEEIAKAAMELLERYGISEPPVDVEYIARKLGIFVRKTPADDDLSGFIVKQGTSFLLGVNAAHHPNRQRFTIGHEIGHFVIHDNPDVHVGRANPDRYVIRRRDGTSTTGEDLQEVEANRFAAELLMPEAFLDNELPHYLINDCLDERGMQQLAKRFQVSVQALSNRLISLKMLDSSF